MKLPVSPIMISTIDENARAFEILLEIARTPLPREEGFTAFYAPTGIRHVREVREALTLLGLIPSVTPSVTVSDIG